MSDFTAEEVEAALAIWKPGKSPVTRPQVQGILAAVLPAHDRRVKAETLREEADDLDAFREGAYGPDLFRRPTKDDYAAINHLLLTERGHMLDGVAADLMDRAIKVQAERLRERAVENGAGDEC